VVDATPRRTSPATWKRDSGNIMNKTINMIVAMSQNGVIGINNKIPWNISQDMKMFREKTFNSSIIMGRKTFESIGKALPKRESIVITNDFTRCSGFSGIKIVGSLEDAIQTATNENIFIIGGEKIYSLALDKGIVDYLYLTLILKDFEPNEGWWTLGHGEAEGTIIGGNLCTLNLLQGTKYMPSLKDSILFLEDDFESSAGTFDRNLQSLIHLPDFKGVRGIVIGRFEKNAANGMPPMSNELLRNLLDNHSELNDLPIIANVDFGHTQPMITFPIGGKARIKGGKQSSIEILTH
jgi:muramoyltetrapeptide carboxypeptidase LdcA involved in peptidoglycan recycling